MNHPESDSKFYKGYRIKPLSNRLKNGNWDLEITLEKYLEDEYIEKQFSSSNQFTSYEEALAACIVFGQKIIDGSIDGLSAP